MNNNITAPLYNNPLAIPQDTLDLSGATATKSKKTGVLLLNSLLESGSLSTDNAPFELTLSRQRCKKILPYTSV